MCRACSSPTAVNGGPKRFGSMKSTKNDLHNVTALITLGFADGFAKNSKVRIMNNVQQQYGWVDTELTDANKIVIPAILSMLPKNGARVLDLGCGNGTLAAALQAQGYEVVGVDASNDGIELARGRFPGIEFKTCSIYDDKFRLTVGGGYEFVISLEVAEHLYWPKMLIKQAHSVLAPGGKFLVSTPYHGYLKNLAISVVDGWDRHFTVDWDGGHIKFFSRATLTQFLLNEKFSDIEFMGVGRFPALWKSMILSGRKQ